MEARFIGLFTRLRGVHGLPLHAIRVSPGGVFFENGPFAGSGLVPGTTIRYDRWRLVGRWFFAFTPEIADDELQWWFLPMRGRALHRMLLADGWTVERVAPTRLTRSD